MKKEVSFTPEFGLFILFIAFGAWLIYGLAYYWYIRWRGMTVTSWWRSVGHNTELGGVSDSLHLVGMAWDIVPVTQENYDILQFAGLRVINEGDHLHAQIV